MGEGTSSREEDSMNIFFWGYSRNFRSGSDLEGGTFNRQAGDYKDFSIWSTGFGVAWSTI